MGLGWRRDALVPQSPPDESARPGDVGGSIVRLPAGGGAAVGGRMKAGLGIDVYQSDYDYDYDPRKTAGRLRTFTAMRPMACIHGKKSSCWPCFVFNHVGVFIMMWNVFFKKSMGLAAGILVGGVCSAVGAIDSVV